MRLLAKDAHVHFHGSPVARDRADAHVRGFEHGALLDVQLEVSGGLRRFVGALPAALAQRVVEAHAVQVLRLFDIGKPQRAREHPATHKARLESGALLVGPIDHGKICLRGKLARAHGLVNRPRSAQRCNHPVGAIEHATVLLAVKMRSAQDVRR